METRILSLSLSFTFKKMCFVVPLIGLCSDALQNRFDSSSSLLLAQSKKDKTTEKCCSLTEQAIDFHQFSSHSTLSDGDAHNARHPRLEATWRASTSLSGVGVSLRRRMAQMAERGVHRWEQLAVVVGMLLLCQTSVLIFMPEPPGNAVNFNNNNNTGEKNIHYDHHGSTSSSFWFVASTISVSACYLAASVIVNGLVIDAASAPSGSSSRRTTDVVSTIIAEGSSHEREALSAAQWPTSGEEEGDNGSEAAKNDKAFFTRMDADDDCGTQRHSDAQASLMWLRSCGSVLGATTEIVLFYWLPSSSSPSSMLRTATSSGSLPAAAAQEPAAAPPRPLTVTPKRKFETTGKAQSRSMSPTSFLRPQAPKRFRNR